MRLQKYLSRAGVASRRKAEELIRQGAVKVNGRVIARLGTTVDPLGDRIEVGNRLVRLPADNLYLLLNKPRGYLTTMHDPYNRRTVRELIRPLDRRVVPVGRLDRDTEGLLIFTSDGELAHRLMHPRYRLPKTYRAKVRGIPTASDLDRLRQGIVLDGRPAVADEVRLNKVNRPHNESVVTLVLHEGRKHQVKRMFKAIGCPVITLKRTGIAFLNLHGLEAGRWRPMTPREIRRLKESVGLK